MEVVKRKRGRPKGSKNKTKITKTKVIKGMEPDKDYLYYFVADACGCRMGANVIGPGMWCQHKNTMHLETHKRYVEVEHQKE